MNNLTASFFPHRQKNPEGKELEINQILRYHGRFFLKDKTVYLLISKDINKIL